MTATVCTTCETSPSRTTLSSLLARLRTRLRPEGRSLDRLDPDRLGRHMLRDLGLDDGRVLTPRRFKWD